MNRTGWGCVHSTLTRAYACKTCFVFEKGTRICSYEGMYACSHPALRVINAPTYQPSRPGRQRDSLATGIVTISAMTRITQATVLGPKLRIVAVSNSGNNKKASGSYSDREMNTGSDNDSNSIYSGHTDGNDCGPS